MTIDPISSNLPSAALQELQANAQARLDMKTLSQDLQAGNIAGAQKDFASLLQDSPHLNNELQSGQTTPQASALSSLSTALQSGNLAGAQTAMASLQQTMNHHRNLASTAASAVASALGI